MEIKQRLIYVQDAKIVKWVDIVASKVSKKKTTKIVTGAHFVYQANGVQLRKQNLKLLVQIAPPGNILLHEQQLLKLNALDVQSVNMELLSAQTRQVTVLNVARDTTNQNEANNFVYLVNQANFKPLQVPILVKIVPLVYIIQ